jgi:hypothetical protein
MSSIIEFVKLPVNELHAQKPEIYEECAKILSQQPGVKNQWYGTTLENPNMLQGFLGTFYRYKTSLQRSLILTRTWHWTEWNTYQEHKDFAKSPQFPFFIQGVQSIAGGEFSMCHVHIDPETTNAFKGPVVSSLTLTVKPGVEKQRVIEVLDAVVEACRGYDKCYGIGWGFTKDDESKAVVVASWESKEVCNGSISFAWNYVILLIFDHFFIFSRLIPIGAYSRIYEY